MRSRSSPAVEDTTPQAKTSRVRPFGVWVCRLGQCSGMTPEQVAILSSVGRQPFPRPGGRFVEGIRPVERRTPAPTARRFKVGLSARGGIRAGGELIVGPGRLVCEFGRAARWVSGLESVSHRGPVVHIFK